MGVRVIDATGDDNTLKALSPVASGDSLRASLRSVLASSAVGDRSSPFHSSRETVTLAR